MKISQNIEENFKKSLDFIRIASENKADLICFSELHLSRFFPQYQKIDVSEFLMTYDSEYIVGIREACAKYKIYASPNLYIRCGGKNYDMSFLIDCNGEIIGNQKMVNIANNKFFYEKDYYCPGEDGFNVFDTEFGKIGIVVCYDRHFPESIMIEAKKGAGLILIPAANTFQEDTELFKWEIKVQAYQNKVNIAMCNRVGTEGEMDFCGESIICDSFGKTLALGSNYEEIIYSEVRL